MPLFATGSQNSTLVVLLSVKDEFGEGRPSTVIITENIDPVR